MEYRQIVAITGLSGLYQLMNTKNDGAIVKSLKDNSVKFISARIHHLTPLESIEIYTNDENVRIHEVFEMIKKDDAPAEAINSKKDDKAAKALFKTYLPNYDEDRVYVSDIKKVFKWYSILKENDLLNFDYLDQEEETAETAEIAEAITEESAVENKEEVKEEKKTAKKPAAKKKATEETGEKVKEKPAPAAKAKKVVKATKTEE